jgi:hypothetical protein
MLGFEITASTSDIRPLVAAGPMLRAFMPDNKSVSKLAFACVATKPDASPVASNKGMSLNFIFIRFLPLFLYFLIAELLVL